MIPWTWCRTGDSRRAPIWLLAGFGPIDVEVPGRGRQPPLVPAPHRELGDDPLPALEVAVEHAEREMSPAWMAAVSALKISAAGSRSAPCHSPISPGAT